MRHTLCRAVAYAVILFCTRCVSCRTTARTKGTATATIIFCVAARWCGGAARAVQVLLRPRTCARARPGYRAARARRPSGRTSAAYDGRTSRIVRLSPHAKIPTTDAAAAAAAVAGQLRQRAAQRERHGRHGLHLARAGSRRRAGAQQHRPPTKPNEANGMQKGRRGFPDGVAHAALATLVLSDRC